MKKKVSECAYERITPSNFKDIPTGACIRYNCPKTGELVEGVVCSYRYETKDNVVLKVEDASGSIKLVSGRPIWLEKKKGSAGSMPRETMLIDSLRDESRLHKQEIGKLKKNISELTAAIKLIRNHNSIPLTKHS